MSISTTHATECETLHERLSTHLILLKAEPEDVYLVHRFIHVTLNKSVRTKAQRLTSLALVTRLGSSARIQPEVFSFQCGAFSIIPVQSKILTWK